MKLTLEPTDKFEGVNGTRCRIWRGKTEAGVDVVAYVAAVSPQTHDEALLAVFERELKALPQPKRELVYFDLRMMID